MFANTTLQYQRAASIIQEKQHVANIKTANLIIMQLCESGTFDFVYCEIIFVGIMKRF